MNADEQAEHAALFKRAWDKLAVQAGQLTSLRGAVKLTPLDVANLHLGTAVNILTVEFSAAVALDHLRELVARLADRLDAGDEPKPN